MKQFDYEKYLKNNPLLREMQEGDMEESFTDRTNATTAKSKAFTEPELIKLFPIIKKECGNEYQASMQKSSKGEGRIFVMPNTTSGGFKGSIGAVIVAHPNATVTVGSAKNSNNNDVFFSSSDKKIFNSLDVDNILDYIATLLEKRKADDDIAEGKKEDGEETWFSDANYFKKEHAGYKLKPTDMVSIGDIPAMTYANALKKYAGNAIKKEGANQGGIAAQLKATISGKNDDMSFLQGTSDKEFVATLKNLGIKFKTFKNDWEMNYYIGKPGNGILFVNDNGDWSAGDWAMSETKVFEAKSSIEKELSAVINGKQDDLKFLQGTSDKEFVAALKKLGINYKSKSDMEEMNYYVGRPGKGTLFVNYEGDWSAGDWAID